MTENNTKTDIKDDVAEDSAENIEASATEESTQEEAVRDIEAELTTMKDQLLRAVAETENLRRRMEKQIEEAGKFAITSFARDLISVQENLHRATEFIKPEQIAENALLKNVTDGVEMPRRELGNVFERHGIKRIEPELGSPFDHNHHQAVAHIPDGNHPAGSVANVMQAGYILKDRLLRPAMVAVAKEVEKDAK